MLISLKLKIKANIITMRNLQVQNTYRLEELLQNIKDTGDALVSQRRRCIRLNLHMQRTSIVSIIGIARVQQLFFLGTVAS